MFKPKVIFICTGNSCRSQIAEGIMRDAAGKDFDVFSAGSHPSHVHPMAIKVMSERGIDISEHTSDPIDYYLDKDMDFVITVCDHANQVCPTFPGNVERLHWSIKDPFSGWGQEDEYIDAFRRTRETIYERIEEFLKSRKDE